MKYSISLIILGFVMSGCVSSFPPLPEKEQLKTMSFQDFLEHRNFSIYDSTKPFYVASASVNTKIKTRYDVQPFVNHREKDFTEFCNAYNGEIKTSQETRNTLFPKSIGSDSLGADIDNALSKKILGWHDIKHVCLVDNTPFFGYSSNIFIENTRVDNSWWTATVKAKEIFSIQDIKNGKAILLTSSEIKNIVEKHNEAENAKKQRLALEEAKQLQIKQQKELRKQSLRNRNGEIVFIFYSGFVGSQYCDSFCLDINEQETGYSHLQEALNDKWKFVNKLSDKKNNFNNCQCIGSEVILKK